jgi:hypothetical protein
MYLSPKTARPSNTPRPKTTVVAGNAMTAYAAIPGECLRQFGSGLRPEARARGVDPEGKKPAFEDEFGEEMGVVKTGAP